jgi:hypothetical protein
MKRKGEMIFPDLHGYELENQIHSTTSRLIVLWFSRIDYATERWNQIQVTLVGARLTMLTLNATSSFPSFKSFTLSENLTERGKTMIFVIYFDEGQMAFKCEDLSSVEYARKLRIIRSA